jgi:hypothetical protein
MTHYTIPGEKSSIPHSNSITVIGEHHTAYNAVIQPDKYVACTQYFIRRWMPLLGGVGTQIVLALRSLGYYNRSTGETRDGIEIDLPGLAKLCGVHESTIKREFQRNKALEMFVTRQKNYRQDRVTGHVLRTTNEYLVKMDDPLHEDDLSKLQEALDARDKPSARKAQYAPNRNNYTLDGKAQYAPNAVQSAPNKMQNAPGIVQSAPRIAQNAPTLKDYSYLPENTLSTPKSLSEFSASLFPGEDQKEKENTYPKYEAKEPVAEVEPKATEVSRPSTPEEEEIILERSRRQGMAEPCKAHLRYAVLGMRKEAGNQCTP